MRDMLTVQEAAKRLQYHPNHVRRMLRAGTIKGERIGNYWFIARPEVDRIKAGQDDMGRFRT